MITIGEMFYQGWYLLHLYLGIDETFKNNQKQRHFHTSWQKYASCSIINITFVPLSSIHLGILDTSTLT